MQRLHYVLRNTSGNSCEIWENNSLITHVRIPYDWKLPNTGDLLEFDLPNGKPVRVFVESSDERSYFNPKRVFVKGIFDEKRNDVCKDVADAKVVTRIERFRQLVNNLSSVVSKYFRGQ